MSTLGAAVVAGGGIGGLAAGCALAAASASVSRVALIRSRTAAVMRDTGLSAVSRIAPTLFYRQCARAFDWHPSGPPQ